MSSSCLIQLTSAVMCLFTCSNHYSISMSNSTWLFFFTMIYFGSQQSLTWMDFWSRGKWRLVSSAVSCSDVCSQSKVWNSSLSPLRNNDMKSMRSPSVKSRHQWPPTGVFRRPSRGSSDKAPVSPSVFYWRRWRSTRFLGYFLLPDGGGGGEPVEVRRGLRHDPPRIHPVTSRLSHVIPSADAPLFRRRPPLSSTPFVSVP